jgi:hypothetical protein
VSIGSKSKNGWPYFQDFLKKQLPRRALNRFSEGISLPIATA